MPRLNEEKRGNELGKKNNDLHKWLPCEGCGKFRWEKIIKGKPYRILCVKCGSVRYGREHKGVKSVYWKGGRFKTPAGYIRLSLAEDDFFRPSASKRGYIFEHRLVMAKYLGRNLHNWEIIHHKNHIRDDNRIENLQLVSDDRHKQITILGNEIARLKQRLSKYE